MAGEGLRSGVWGLVEVGSGWESPGVGSGFEKDTWVAPLVPPCDF